MFRYFSYIDVPTIESFYNQLESGYEQKTVHVSKKRETGGEIAMSLKNIILGYFTGEGRLHSAWQKETGEELQQRKSIEAKVMDLIPRAKGREEDQLDLAYFEDGRSLVCGMGNVIESHLFIENCADHFQRKIDSYEECVKLLRGQKECLMELNSMNAEGFSSNGMSPLRIMSNWYKHEEEMFSFVILDHPSPIEMELSYKKITMPHSDIRSSTIFTSINQFRVLGISNRRGDFYSLKPLALWTIMGEEGAKHSVGRQLAGWMED